MRFVSKQGQPQPHVLLKARAPSPQLLNGLFKTVLDCGFHAMDSGFFASGTWILDSIVSGIPDSLSCTPDSRFQKQKSTRFQNLVRFPYLRR